MLEGLRVIEVSSFVAAPLGGMTLAQLGADVIRVDPLGGAADYRRWPLADTGISLYWTGLNKAKRSIMVDFRSPEGREVVADLITAAGVLLTNVSFLDDAVLRARRSDLVHVQVRGRHDGSAAVDYTVNAGIGFPMVTGPVDLSGPVNHVLPAWDIACGLYAALGVVAAVGERATSGRGRYVTVALEDVALAAAGNLGYLAEAQVNGTIRERSGNDVYGTFGRDFACHDGGRVMVVALTPRHWKELVALTESGAVVAALESALGLDFTVDGDRYTHRHALGELFAPWFAARATGEVLGLLTDKGVLCSRYGTFADVVADADKTLQANPLMSTIDQAGVGPYLAPGSPLVVDGGRAAATPAPALGADGPEVLAEVLGLPAERVAVLVAAGVIGSRPGSPPAGPQ